MCNQGEGLFGLLLYCDGGSKITNEKPPPQFQTMYVPIFEAYMGISNLILRHPHMCVCVCVETMLKLFEQCVPVCVQGFIAKSNGHFWWTLES